MHRHRVVGCLLITILVLGAPRLLCAQSSDTDDYVILAEQLIKLGPVNLIASGNVGVDAVGGMLVAKGRLASGDGTHIVADTVYIKNPGSLYSLWANHPFLKPGVAVRPPEVLTGWPAPIMGELPATPSMSPGSSDLRVDRKMAITLSPADYARVKIKTKGTVVFTGGTYNFDSIKTASTARLLFTAPTVVNVKNGFSIGPFSIIGPIGPGTSADDITFNVASTRVSINNQVTVAARIIAPLAALKVGLAGLIKGQLVAREVRLGSGTVVQQVGPLRPFGLRTASPTITPLPTFTPSPTSTPLPTDTPTPISTDTATPTATPPATPTDTPAAAPTVAICGNAQVEGGEECDDGNLADGDGCSSACRIEHGTGIGSQFCTLTQGAFGASNGIANGPNGFLTLHPEILPVTLGGPGESTTLTSQAAVIAYLPKSGAPTHLLAGERTFTTGGDVVPDGGGELSGQTLVLTLASNLSSNGDTFSGLASLILPDLPFCTQRLTAGLDGVLGTADDELDLSSTVSGPWSLPATVAVANNTVADLLLMANQYLRGGSSAPPIGDVNTALDTLNQAFDECRQVVACP